MAAKQLTSIRDLAAADVAQIFELAADVKSAPDKYRNALSGRTLGILFEEPSTRTRVSFLSGASQLGATPLQLNEADLELATGESLSDTATVLSGYVDGIVARMRSHADFVELAKASEVPVINARTDLLHPCQALAGFFTLRERLGPLDGKSIAYVGEGNYACHSLVYGAVKAGMNITIATPTGYEPKSIILKSANREAGPAGVTVTTAATPAEAVAGADAVYTSGWSPPPDDADIAARGRAIQEFQVNEELMAKASPGAWFLHPMPVRRGVEVADAVVESEKSLVFEQARNALYIHKAILCAFAGSG